MNPSYPTFITTLLQLLVAHLVSDYFFQFKDWVSDKAENKVRSPMLYAHIAVTFLSAGLFTGRWDVAAFIALTHGLIDIAKMYWGRRDVTSLVIDQLMHLIILIISSLYISNDWLAVSQFWETIRESQSFWAVLFGYAFITFPLGEVVGILTHRWRNELNEPYGNLEVLNEAGKWIGIAERTLILTLILINQFSLIGFWLVAKALFRGNSTERQLSSYYLVGTLLSVTFTVIVGLIVTALL